MNTLLIKKNEKIMINLFISRRKYPIVEFENLEQ